MAKIKIKELPFDDSLGGIRYEKTTKQTQGKRVPADSSPQSLLTEAIRFYNYGLQRETAGHLTGFQFEKGRRKWKPLDPSIMEMAVRDLCFALRDTIVDMAEQLTSVKTLRKHLKNGVEKRFPLHISSNRALLAAHLLLSDGFRDEQERKKHPKKWLARDFEKLENAFKDLRKPIKTAYIEQTIVRQYGKYLLKGANVEEFLFRPYWGGSYLIQPEELFWHPEEPFYPHYSPEVGTTEKLHLCVVSSAFSPETIIRSVPKTNPRTPCKFLTEIDEKVEAIRRFLPSLEQKRRPDTHWRQMKRQTGAFVDNRAIYERTAIWWEWIENLRELEHLFGNALEVRHYVYDVKTWPGVIVGLPCALALIGVLRTYIADLMGRALMIALPLAINEIYNWVNGYFAVALWEALSGEDAEGMSQRGCLGWLSDMEALGDSKVGSLVGILSSWRGLALEKKVWGHKNLVHAAALKSLQDLSTSPLVKKGEQKPHWMFAVKNVSRNICFSDYKKEYLRRYPVIRNELGIKRSPGSDSDWLHGARFTAQVHLFVAHQILERAGRILWQDWESRKPYKTQDYNEKEFKKRRWLNYRVGAGSYWWAGRKPPHRTHVEGVNFDVNFGPDIVPWPNTVGLRKAYNTCKGITSNHRQKIKGIARQQKVKTYYAHVPVVICYTQGARKQAEKGVHRRLVYRQLIHGKVNDARKELVKHARLTIEKKDPKTDEELQKLIKQEESDYEKQEQRLLGTPHFMDTKEAFEAGVPSKYRTELPDWQRTHAAHVALMLSAPRSLVFASPIVHFRAMRAIRTAFRGRKCFSLASELVASIYFDFKPQDHYHHWHVNYHHFDALSQLKNYIPLWIEMGIDLEPLVNYLENYPKPSKPSKLMAETLEEHRQVLKFCKQYKQEKSKYEEKLELDPEDSRKESDEVFTKIFKQFKPGGEQITSTIKRDKHLSTPTIKREHLNNLKKPEDLESEILRNASEATQKVTRVILKILKEVGCITKKEHEAYTEDEEVLDEVPTLEEEFLLSPPVMKESGSE